MRKIYLRSSSHIFCYEISDNSWEEKKDMALSDRSMALFFSNQLEEGRTPDSPTKDVAIFKSKIEKLMVKAKLAGDGPWGELYQKDQITQVERDLMATFESALVAERLSIFKKMDPANNVFQQLFDEEPSSEAKERIEWLAFQALQEDASLGHLLCSVCPNVFKKTETGTYTWTPPGSVTDESLSPRKSSRRKLMEDEDDDEEEGLKDAKASSERIMVQLKEKKIQVPEEFICPITRSIMLEPVATTDGHAFERVAIETWFAKDNDTSPVTHLKIDTSIIPNLPLRKLIKAFLDSHKVDMG